jgi:septal ring factor EnvC (AmiA/AmiB activator)
MPYILKHLTMDNRILDLFMKENDAWEDMISRQKNELPTLDTMITNIMADKKVREDKVSVFAHLRKEMVEQEKNMEKLEVELEKQQKYLHEQRRRKGSDPHSINTLFSQKILRERIKDVERSFVELKCNYLNYIATI